VERSYNPHVTQVSEAKDFLVRQTAIQPGLDGVPLSDLEKRMMYVTEGPDAAEDPVALNDEFESEYDTPTFEAKVSKLLHRAYVRVKEENPETARTWNESIRILRKGDHYILVLWNKPPQERPPHDSLKLFATAFLVIVVGGALMLGFILIAEHYHFHWPWDSSPETHRSVPVWLGRLLIFMMAAGYAYYVVLPWIFKKPAVPPSELVFKLLRRSSAETSDRETEKFNRKS
jgi:hypothetical protein